MDPLPLVDLRAPPRDVAQHLGAACRAHGFFYVVGHGVEPGCIARLEAAARSFFALDEPTKLRWPMAAGGRAWRGYFPVGGELTSGRPDWKEGLYLGTELPDDHPLVRAGVPMHGRNLFPDVPGLRRAVLDYLEAVTALGHRVMAFLALSLGLPEDYFEQRFTAEPLVLLRLFNYPSWSPPAQPAAEPGWGVGEHSDYGLLTILLQDDVGGLQVRTPTGWIEARPVPGSFVCNIGDMLDLMTGGLYRSTPHRVVVNRSGRDRLSIPLFFDPGFESVVQRIEGLPPPQGDSTADRWDRANVHAFDGRYGDYLLTKVGRVFPALRDAVL